MMKTKQLKIIYLLAPLAYLGVMGLCLEAKFSMNTDIILSSLMLILGLRIFGFMQDYLAFLLLFCVIMLAHIAPTQVVFSGFASEGFWLILAGMIIGQAIKATGLAQRISLLLQSAQNTKYSQTIARVIILGIIISFIMPSAMGRVMLLIPILSTLSDQLNYPQKNPARTGIILAGVLSTYYTGFTQITSNLPNVIMLGSMQSILHFVPSYTQYLLLNFPVLGLLKSLLLMLIIIKLFSKYANNNKTSSMSRQKVHLNSAETRLIIYLTLLVVTWLTDSIHHLSPAWSAMLIGCLCLLPKIGFIDHKQFTKQSDMAPLLYVAGIIGMSAVINYTGIGAMIAEKIFHLLPFKAHHPLQNIVLLKCLASVLGLITTLPGVPAILTPLSKSMAHLTGLPIKTVLMTQVLGFSTLILPYQAPPIIVAASLGNIPLKRVIHVCLLTSLLSFLILFPLNLAWWNVLGWI